MGYAKYALLGAAAYYGAGAFRLGVVTVAKNHAFTDIELNVLSVAGAALAIALAGKMVS